MIPHLNVGNVVLAYVRLLFCVFSIIGNGLIILATMKSKYQQTSKHKFAVLGVYAILVLTYSISLSSLTLIDKTNKVLLYCSIIAAYGTKYTTFRITSLIVQCLICVIYFITYLAVKRMSSESVKQSVFKTILITVIFDVAGRILAHLIGLVDVGNDPQKKLTASMLSAMVVTLATATNVFIYYFRSSAYRKAIRSVLHLENSTIVTLLTSGKNDTYGK